MEKVANNVIKNAETDQDVTLSSLWSEGPAIIYFLRRFGCQICRWHAKNVSQLAAPLDGKNVRFVAIGPEKLGWDEFVQGKFWASPEVYYDPEKKLYQELGMKRSGILGVMGGMLTKKTWDMVGKTRSAGVSGNLKGDIYQLGGLFVVDKGGDKILYEFRQADFNDYPDVQAIAKSLGVEYTPAPETVQPVCNSESCTMPTAQTDGAAKCDAGGACGLEKKDSGEAVKS
jgi:prostamide/prostaglandin F2alpha synthase